jgi:hypothetical protein
MGDGYNFSGFRFAAPVSLDNNVFIARIDYQNDRRQTYAVLAWCPGESVQSSGSLSSGFAAGADGGRSQQGICR